MSLAKLSNRYSTVDEYRVHVVEMNEVIVHIKEIPHLSELSASVLLSLVTSLVLTFWITGLLPSLVYLVDFSIDSSQHSVQPHGWCVTLGSTTTSLHCFTICTGCESLTESSFTWPSSCSGVAATPRRHIYPKTCTGQRTATLGDDIRHHPTSRWCPEQD